MKDDWMDSEIYRILMNNQMRRKATGTRPLTHDEARLFLRGLDVSLSLEELDKHYEKVLAEIVERKSE